MLAGTMPGAKKPKSWHESGFLKQGETLEALAAACGLDPAALRATVKRFNGFVRNGRDEDFQRGDHVYDRWLGDALQPDSTTLGAIEQGPFYALQVYPGDVSTFGGIVTDEHARALREDGSVIPGLYATGTSTASVMGRAAPGAGASIGPSFTWGYVAAKHDVSTGSNQGPA
jgi:3-oxosteroid 1-dehydrogenase